MVPRSISVIVMAVSISLTALVGTFVSPASPASAAASLSLSRDTVAPGDTVTVQGYGFAAQDSVVVSATIRVNGGTTQAQASAVTSNGYFRADLQIPRGTNQDTYTVQARDFHGGVASRSINVIPLINVVRGRTAGAVYIIPLHSFYVVASGFSANEPIAVSITFPLYNGNSVIVSRTIQATSSGGFSEALFTAPADAKSGVTTLSAVGQSSHRSGRARIHVFYRSYLLAPRDGAARSAHCDSRS